MNNSQSYIYPIYSRENVRINNSTNNAGQGNNLFTDTHSEIIDTLCGNGFFVGDYFVTAAHVISAVKFPFIKMNGQEFFLKQTDAIVWRKMSENPKGEEFENTDNADVRLSFKLCHCYVQ